MTEAPVAPHDTWQRAVLAAALFAVAPWHVGGIQLKARCGPVRERWLQWLDSCMPEGTPSRRIPVNVGDERLLGGIDLGATLATGRAVSERGILALSDGGLVTLASAERVELRTAGHIAAAMDQGEVRVERDGVSFKAPARFGLVMLDEAAADDEGAPGCLTDRVAFKLDLDGIPLADTCEMGGAYDIAQARRRFSAIQVDEASLTAICAAADALGVASVRVAILALAVARASAALAGRDRVDEDDLCHAAAFVLAPRATRVPVPEQDQEQDQPDPETPEPPEDEANPQALDPDELTDMAIAAAAAVIPPDLLRAMAQGNTGKDMERASGRAGAERRSMRSGRPLGVRAGKPRSGSRLDIPAMLRAAAPWQAVRRREAGSARGPGIIWRTDDFRSKRFKQHNATMTVFVVDASGSSALHRLAEAKGAVELLLVDCYVRRDQVALVAFRGKTSELLLPPTRSLVRAKRCLAGLPGGGGTPLAAAIGQARDIGVAARRKGFSVSAVFLTDGRANVAKDGRTGRDAGAHDALAEARVLRLTGLTSLVIDTSPRPNPQAGHLAEALGARYLPLPHADAHTLSTAVRVATAG